MTTEVFREADAVVRCLFRTNELLYAGLFAIRNVPEEQLHPFLFAEAPRLLFPFARRVIADVIRDGGFPPLLIDPIDFGAMYLAQAQATDENSGIIGHA